MDIYRSGRTITKENGKIVKIENHYWNRFINWLITVAMIGIPVLLLVWLFTGCQHKQPKPTQWLTLDEARQECPRCLGGMKAVMDGKN